MCLTLKTSLNTIHVNSIAMASQRRINTTEKTHLDQDEVRLQSKSNISPAVPSFVSLKPLILGTTLPDIHAILDG
jgi:hypothetical protein